MNDVPRSAPQVSTSVPSTATERLVEQVRRDGGPGQLIGEPGGVDAGGSRVENLAQLDEEPLDPWIGLVRVPRGDAESSSLVVGQGVRAPGPPPPGGPGDGDAGRSAATPPRSPPGSAAAVARPRRARNGARTSTRPERRISCRAMFSSAALVGRPPLVSIGARLTGAPLATWLSVARRPAARRSSSRSESTVTPWRPAARHSSGSRVPASRWATSQVERRRAGASRGCPVGTTSRSVRCPVRRADMERPPTRNSSPAVAARASELVLPLRQGHDVAGGGLPHHHVDARARTASTSRAPTRVTHRPSSPVPSPSAKQRPRRPAPGRGGLSQGVAAQELHFVAV